MDIGNVLNQEVKIVDRNKIELSGIKKINTFDKEEFFIESNMGSITIKGSNMELVHLDTQEGKLKIRGKINSFIYVDSVNKQKEESFISKLFK